jgi:hypothetical protein
MAANESKPGETTQDALGQGQPKAVEVVSNGNAAGETPAAPLLSAYYSASQVKSSAFVKAVRAAKIKSFDAEDVAEAARHLGEFDPTLARTVALLNKGPDPIARWVLEATKASLRLYLPGAEPEEHEGANSLFDRVVRMSVEDLAAKDKRRRGRAQNLLRLVLAWLISQRNLSPTDALLSARKAKKRKDGATASSLNRDAAQLLARSKPNQLMELSLVAALFESSIAQSAKERQEIFSTLAGLRDRISTQETELQTASAELEKVNEDRACLRNELAAAQNDLRNEKELRALERTRQASKFRGFLTERLSLPLSDARDALDFDPPQVDAARQRIEMAITAISGEV